MSTNPNQSTMGSGGKQGESLQQEVAGAPKMAVEENPTRAEAAAVKKDVGGFGQKGEEAGAGGTYQPGAKKDEGEPGSATAQAEAGGFSS